MNSVTSLYIHVPFCRHLCNYCDFFKHKFERPSAQRKEFEIYLKQSFERHESIMREFNVEWSDLETLYLGGGTASLWDQQGAEVFKSLGIRLAQTCEATLEVDPGSWTEEGLRAWEEIGVNRYSVGTQSFDPEYLKVLDRAHSRDETITLLERLKGKNFSVDFLLGSPKANQNRDILKELDELLSFEPKHLSLYILQPAAGYKLKALIPNDEIVSGEYLQVSDYLQGKGFHHYEVSNFALPGFESKHNLRYWHGESVAALGPTGTGYFNLGPTKAYRYKWKPSQAEILGEPLSHRELMVENLYLRLRLSEPLSAELLGIEPSKFQLIMSRWQDLGHVKMNDGAWRMQNTSWVILDSLISDLL
jgi:oxygen-independent coproporphyrinogen III oxidase